MRQLRSCLSKMRVKFIDHCNQMSGRECVISMYSVAHAQIMSLINYVMVECFLLFRGSAVYIESVSIIMHMLYMYCVFFQLQHLWGSFTKWLV